MVSERKVRSDTILNVEFRKGTTSNGCLDGSIPRPVSAIISRRTSLAPPPKVSSLCHKNSHWNLPINGASLDGGCRPPSNPNMSMAIQNELSGLVFTFVYI